MPDSTRGARTRKFHQPFIASLPPCLLMASGADTFQNQWKRLTSTIGSEGAPIASFYLAVHEVQELPNPYHFHRSWRV